MEAWLNKHINIILALGTVLAFCVAAGIALSLVLSPTPCRYGIIWREGPCEISDIVVLTTSFWVMLCGLMVWAGIGLWAFCYTILWFVGWTRG